MKITGICFTRSGMELAQRMHSYFSSENAVSAEQTYEDTWFCKGKLFRDNVPEGFSYVEEGCQPWAGKYFADSDAMIFIGATGICVRAIAPYVKDKKTDPAVICFDEKGIFGISLLSGHIGGANALTTKLCQELGSIPVVTTATDVNKKFAVDVFATENHLAISSMELAKDVAAALVEGKTVPMSYGVRDGGSFMSYGVRHQGSFSQEKLQNGAGGKFLAAANLPGGLAISQDLTYHNAPLGIHISPFYKDEPYQDTLYLIPRCMTIGIGCRRDTPVEKIEALVDATLKEYKIHPEALTAVATIDLKKDEKGLLEFCHRRNLSFTVYTAEELQAAKGEFSASKFVSGITGVDNVCERSAVVKGGGELIIKKTKGDGVTCAVTLQNWRIKL